MNFKKVPNMIVPAGLSKNAWVAVNVTALHHGTDSAHVPMHQVARKFIQQQQASKETPNNKRLLAMKEIWKSFAETTTGHGFARIVDQNQPKSLRIFWVVVIVILVFALLVSISMISYETLIVRGLRREFIVQNNKTLMLPDIHICDTSLFNRTILQEMGFNDTMASYLTLALSHLLASRSIIENTDKRQRLDDEFHRILKGKTIQHVFQQAALRCQDIILGCTHENVLYSSSECCSKFFGNRRYVTDLASLCVSTHYQPHLEEIFDFQIYGFAVYMKTNIHDRFEFDSTIISSNVASRRGIMYGVSDFKTAVNPTISTVGHYTTPGTWTSVSISLTRTDNTELQKGVLSTHSCVFPDSADHLHLVPNHNVYSQRNCVFASTRAVLEEKLNCSRFRFDRMGSLSPCYPDVMIGVHSPQLANEIKQKSEHCPEDCLFDDYHVSSSTSQLNLGDHDDMHKDEEHDDRFIHTAIHFFYPSFSFTIIKNHPENLVKWLSDIGGNMSLYLGASFVTLLEIVVLFARFARKCFR